MARSVFLPPAFTEHAQSVGTEDLFDGLRRVAVDDQALSEAGKLRSIVEVVGRGSEAVQVGADTNHVFTAHVEDMLDVAGDEVDGVVTLARHEPVGHKDHAHYAAVAGNALDLPITHVVGGWVDLIGPDVRGQQRHALARGIDDVIDALAGGRRTVREVDQHTHLDHALDHLLAQRGQPLGQIAPHGGFAREFDDIFRKREAGIDDLVAVEVRQGQVSHAAFEEQFQAAQDALVAGAIAAQAMRAFHGMYHADGTREGCGEQLVERGDRGDHFGRCVAAGLGDGFFHIAHDADGGVVGLRSHQLAPQVGAQHTEDVDQWKIFDDAPFGDMDDREDQVKAAVAQAREAGPRVKGAAAQAALHHVADPQGTVEQLLLHGGVNMKIHDGGFAVNLPPV